MLDKVIANSTDFCTDNEVSIQSFSQNKHLVIAISNNGPLLPSEMTNQLFDSMISVRPSELQQQPHLGMGLYIARLISEFHHGVIMAKNRPDNTGVIFTIKIPMV